MLLNGFYQFADTNGPTQAVCARPQRSQCGVDSLGRRHVQQVRDALPSLSTRKILASYIDFSPRSSSLAGIKQRPTPENKQLVHCRVLQRFNRDSVTPGEWTTNYTSLGGLLSWVLTNLFFWLCNSLSNFVTVCTVVLVIRSARCINPNDTAVWQRHCRCRCCRLRLWKLPETRWISQVW